MSYGRPHPAPAKRTALSIHPDNCGPDITLENPAPVNTLTLTFICTSPRYRHIFTSTKAGEYVLEKAASNPTHALLQDMAVDLLST
jgi:hypothetical protein